MRHLIAAAALTLALTGVAQAGSPYEAARRAARNLTVHPMGMGHMHVAHRVPVPRRLREVRVRHVDQFRQAEREGFRKVSDLTKGEFPPFYPSLGIVTVKPDTLPMGPFRCFDRAGNLVSTVYMPLLSEMDGHKTWDKVRGLPAPVDHMTMYYHPGHPGVNVPHYHVVMWHVRNEAAVAK